MISVSDALHRRKTYRYKVTYLQAAEVRHNEYSLQTFTDVIVGSLERWLRARAEDPAFSLIKAERLPRHDR